MKTVLLAVDGTKASAKTARTMADLFRAAPPERVVLLHVQQMEGASVLDDLIVSDAELATLKEALQGTEYQELLDKQSKRILDYFERYLTEQGIANIEPVVREGHPAEEILAAAEEHGAELIVMGSRGERFHSIFLGSVSREVANNAACAVLLVK